VKYWELIADDLSKAGWSWGVLQLWVAKGEQYGLWPQIATVNASLCTPMKNDCVSGTRMRD
jgi:hypothetical protein